MMLGICVGLVLAIPNVHLVCKPVGATASHLLCPRLQGCLYSLCTVADEHAQQLGRPSTVDYGMFGMCCCQKVGSLYPMTGGQEHYPMRSVVL